jgi:hypothetical protein
VKIIGIAGLGRAGKTTAANALAENCVEEGLTPYRRPFAQPLKNAMIALGITKGDLPVLYRKVAQMIGANLRDPGFCVGTSGDDWFCKQMEADFICIAKDDAAKLISGETYHETVIIVDDVRYENELDLIKSWGGTTLFVDAYRRLSEAPSWKDAWRNHESEEMALRSSKPRRGKDLYDYRLGNNLARSNFTDLIKQSAPFILGTAPHEV